MVDGSGIQSMPSRNLLHHISIVLQLSYLLCPDPIKLINSCECCFLYISGGRLSGWPNRFYNLEWVMLLMIG